MKIKKLLLTAVLLTFNGVSGASTDDGWMLYTDSPVGSLYIHPKSIASDVFGHKTMWIKIVNPTPVDGVKTTKTLNVYDCDSKNQGVSHFIQYDNNNNVIKEFRLPTITAAKNTLDPDSFHYEMIKLLCY